MTQDEIIEMARQAEKYAYLQVSDTDMDIWEKTVYLQFAKLVAAKEREKMDDVAMKAAEKGIDVAMKLEREACASIEYDLAKSPAMFATMAEYKAYKDGVQEYRARIIARGEP